MAARVPRGRRGATFRRATDESCGKRAARARGAAGALLPRPPVPVRLRRRLIEFGSGEPTRAICSTLIARAFQSVRYPILPYVEYRPADGPGRTRFMEEVLRARHHSLFTPRDFDISPYFRAVKPRIERGFDPGALRWDDSG